MTFDWGAIKWFVTPGQDQAAMTFGEVILLPRKRPCAAQSSNV